MIRSMSKLSLRSRHDRGLALAEGFSRGLAQAVSGGAPHKSFPRVRTPAEALKGDWVKLGGDMREAVERVRARGG